ncbi:MAG: glycosyltransferase N-terminal domain-containing protein [Rikenellaceae bacterium]
MFIYSIAIALYGLIAKIVALWSPKARLWCDGRRNIINRITEAIPSTERIVWVHVASLGEFEQGRPIIEKIRKEHPDYKILLTFFSPSGYEIRHNYEGADYVFYLPNDTPSNVAKFLDIVKPEVVIFVKYEFWLNYLSALRRRNIRSFIVSAIFRENSIFFRPWGFAWRDALTAFETIFVQDDNSKKLLAEWGFDNVVVAGDTRFDRVWDIAQNSKKLPIIENFVGQSDMMIAGSSWEADEEIILPLIAKNENVKFIIAPHEIGKERIDTLSSKLTGKCVKYSECGVDSSFEGVQVLILDTMGMLSSVYKYAKWGYIGGGFGKGIHNTLEAATFGLPIAFGTNYHKFKEACDLISLGGATSVGSAEELDVWFTKLQNKTTRDAVSQKNLDYTSRKRGATALITRSIFRD